MWEAVTAVFQWLIPPHDATPEAVYRYRIGVSGFLLVIAMTVATHIALACGYFAGTIIGFPGFARADAVNDVAKNIQRIEVSQLGSTIWSDQGLRCKQIKNNNQAAIGLLSQKINDELGQYYELKHRPYLLPDCSIIGDQ